MIGDRQAARDAVKRRRARRGQLIAATSSVIVLGGLATLILTSPGWPAVRETFFSSSVFRDSFPGILSAFWLDVKIFVVVEVVVLIVGLLLALIRTSRLRRCSRCAFSPPPGSMSSVGSR